MVQVRHWALSRGNKRFLTVRLIFHHQYCSYVLSYLWHRSLSVKQKNHLQGIVMVCSKLQVYPQMTFTTCIKSGLWRKHSQSRLIPDIHCAESKFLPLLYLPPCRTNRFTRSRITFVISLVNDIMERIVERIVFLLSIYFCWCVFITAGCASNFSLGIIKTPCLD